MVHGDAGLNPKPSALSGGLGLVSEVRGLWVEVLGDQGPFRV